MLGTWGFKSLHVAFCEPNKHMILTLSSSPLVTFICASLKHIRSVIYTLKITMRSKDAY